MYTGFTVAAVGFTNSMYYVIIVTVLILNDIFLYLYSMVMPLQLNVQNIFRLVIKKEI